MMHMNKSEENTNNTDTISWYNWYQWTGGGTWENRTGRLLGLTELILCSSNIEVATGNHVSYIF